MSLNICVYLEQNQLHRIITREKIQRVFLKLHARQIKIKLMPEKIINYIFIKFYTSRPENKANMWIFDILLSS